MSSDRGKSNGNNGKKYYATRDNQNNNTKSKRNPSLGGPGFLLTCERGREGKCKREGMQILRHYYYQSKSNSDSSSKSQFEPRSELVADAADSTEAARDVTATTATTTTTTVDSSSLTLEQEIEMLKKGASTDQVLREDTTVTGNGNRTLTGKMQHSSYEKVPFAVYDTGVNGTVFVMLLVENCSSSLMEPLDVAAAAAGQKRSILDGTSIVQVGESDAPLPVEEQTRDAHKKKRTSTGTNHTNTDNDDDKDAKEEDSSSSVIKPTTSTDATSTVSDKGDDDTTANDAVTKKAILLSKARSIWDPVDTLHRIVRDIQESTADAPGSRFVTRMIPIQATCFASLVEIQLTSKVFIQQYLWPHTNYNKPNTFCITLKRRNCSNVTREQVIETVAAQLSAMESANGQAAALWKVSFDNPDFTIQIEICKTLCGFLVIRNCGSLRKFNLVAIREATAALAAESSHPPSPT